MDATRQMGTRPADLRAAAVHVVDDDPSVTDALRAVLVEAGHQVRCHASPGEFLRAWPLDAPACVLLDVHMPGPSALEMHLALARDDAPAVVYMTGQGYVPMSVLAIKRCGVEVLTKPIEREAVLAAVERGIVRSRARLARHDRRSTIRERFALLTSRERTVFEQVAAGRLNKQIAATLCTCERTVKAHRASVMQKMQARSVAELVRIATQLEGDPQSH